MKEKNSFPIILGSNNSMIIPSKLCPICHGTCSSCWVGKKNENMKDAIIIFDVDGTIYGSPFAHKGEPVLNVKTVQLMQLLKDHIKNCKIYVWSGGGKEY